VNVLNNIIVYKASWLFNIPFSFLPVNRLAVDLVISIKKSEKVACQDANLKCENGQCFQYSNSKTYYCRCNKGWSGRLCDIQHQCPCSPGSVCIGTTIDSRPICICPLGKIGPLCYIFHGLCKRDSCKNGGICVVLDQRVSRGFSFGICSSAEYYSEFCHRIRNKVHISFVGVSVPMSLLVHFILIYNYHLPDRTTLVKQIPMYQNNLIIHRSSDQLFQIIYLEFQNNYYLIHLRKSKISSKYTNAIVTPSNRCPHIQELLNNTIVSYHLLKGIKHYHRPCQQQHELKCFYDETQMCLCTDDHNSDCFDFDHNMTYNCNGYNYCENDGICFQDQPYCPTDSVCICKPCYYGNLCHLSSSYFVLSLDAIIGYHIQRYTKINHQPFIVKLSIVITTIMLTFGIISNLLSILTFKQKKTRDVGCGIYLLSSSIISLLIICMFVLKFWGLLLTQMMLFTNQTYLHVDCILTEFLLKFLLPTDDWLNASVAIERVATVTLGANFNKSKSKRSAKFIIIFIIVINIASSIHDPINRRLIEDPQDQRSWCFVSYQHSTLLTSYNTVINMIHFILPFIINSA
ncbi:unnamed protein product, partial [Didymodactylos carnosus]